MGRPELAGHMCTVHMTTRARGGKQTADVCVTLCIRLCNLCKSNAIEKGVKYIKIQNRNVARHMCTVHMTPDTGGVTLVFQKHIFRVINLNFACHIIHKYTKQKTGAI